MIQDCNERRKYRRFQITCPISFVSYDKLRIGQTADLSLGGMKIYSRCMLFTGETYDFTVVMNGRSISPKGRIVYLENTPDFTYGAGVSFLHLSEDHENQLNGFLSAEKSRGSHEKTFGDGSGSRLYPSFWPFHG